MFDLTPKKKKILTVSAIIYALLIPLFILIVNFDKFSTWVKWINSKIDIFAPIIIGAIIAYLCLPLVHFSRDRILKKMNNTKAKNGLSILFTYIIVLGIVIAFVALIIPQLFSSAEDFFRNMTDGTYLNAAIQTVNDFINKLFQGENSFIDKQKIIEYIRAFFDNSGELFKQIGNFVLAYASNFVVSIKNIFLGFLLSVYFLIFKDRIFALSRKFCHVIIPEKRFHAFSNWVKYANTTFGGFVVGKLIDAIFMMLACSVVFGIAGIPYPILISVIIGISNIIPFFGPFIGAFPSGFIVLIASDVSTLILFVVLFLIIQQFDANVVEPKIVGDKTGLTSLGVIVAVLVMSGYFGILGTFFGVPIFAIICSLIRILVDSALKKKNLSTDLLDYYSENALVKTSDKETSSRANLFSLIERFLVFVFRKIKQFFVFCSSKSKVKAENKKKKNKNNKDNP